MGTSLRSNRRKALRRVRRDRVPLSTTFLQSEEKKQQILQQCLNAPKLQVPIEQDSTENEDVKMQDVKIKKKKKKKNRGVELMMTKDPKTEAVKKFLVTLKENRKLKRLERIQKAKQLSEKKPASLVIAKEFKKKVGDKRFNKRKYKNKPKDISDVV